MIDRTLNRQHFGTQRINRILSLAGLASRRKADDFIRAGRVMLNGRVVKEPGGRAVWGQDSIKVDGQEIPGPFERVYLMLNKPFGYICSLSDPSGRPIVGDLLKDVTQRVYPVGRLDFDSLGLLLLTNDGEWAHHLSHPRYHAPRTYKVTLDGKISDEAVDLLKKGIPLEDGFSGSSKTTLLWQSESKSLIRMTITSGRSRIVRRMVAAVGYRVVHLVRTGFGVLDLGNLKVGNYRYLETHEVQAMNKMVGLV
ncbi:MAG: pseudouridine synthase [Thermodesulfobacteriota bacterium]|nr:pseudouridine synthase [Thermodesulfobacteriota bacterium]